MSGFSLLWPVPSTSTHESLPSALDPSDGRMTSEQSEAISAEPVEAGGRGEATDEEV